MDIQFVPLSEAYKDSSVPNIVKRYFDGSNKAQIWALSDGKFFTVKTTSMCGILCDTYMQAKGYRDMLVQRYDVIERSFR